jgi:hypothetical protein
MDERLGSVAELIRRQGRELVEQAERERRIWEWALKREKAERGGR